MFKKVIFCLLATAAISARSQVVQFENGKVNSFVISYAGSTDCHVPFTNISGNAARFVYEKVSVKWPSQWIVTVCDNVNCFSSLNNRDTFATVSNNAKTELKYTVYPMGHKDSGIVTYSMYVAGAPTVRDTFTAKFYVLWDAGVKSVKSEEIQIYPNPAAETIHVMSPASGSCEISNAQGATVQKNNLQLGANDLNINELNKGVYFISIFTPEGVLRKQFVKL